jgi:hypothetical protein
MKKKNIRPTFLKKTFFRTFKLQRSTLFSPDTSTPEPQGLSITLQSFYRLLWFIDVQQLLERLLVDLLLAAPNELISSRASQTHYRGIHRHENDLLLSFIHLLGPMSL